MKQIFAALLLSLCLRAQVNETTEGWFPFPMPGLDAAAGTAVDLSPLNAEPAGKYGFLQVVDGHFEDGRGQAVRLIGTNITGDSCFMDAETADRLAKRLRQFGFNCLRLHFMDFTWGDRGIWEDPDAGKLSEEQLRRLDYLIHACARNGIYTNLNLHVARAYPGQPQIPGNRTFRMGKTLDRWYDPYVKLLEEYARTLLDRRSTVSGIRWGDNPAIGVIEINNENTMISEIRPSYRQLPEPFKGAFLKKWNDWLKAKYKTTAALRQSWNRDIQELGTELLTGKWVVETGQGSEAQLITESGILRWEATKSGKSFWNLQMQYKKLKPTAGRYTFSFRARSKTSNVVGHTLMLDCPPWTAIGLRLRMNLTPEWQQFNVSSPVAAITDPNATARLNFSLSNKTGNVEFADLSLRPGGGKGLPKGQSLETGVEIPGDGVVKEVTRDWYAFLIDTEMATTRQLVRFLKEELHCRAPISDTQVSYGGAGGCRREYELCDYIDIHGYWQHPHYQRDEKGRTTGFKIPNSSQVASPSGGTLGGQALYRLANRPFSISEYNTPAPNDHGAELFPLLAAMASLQDWDALYSYTYRDFGKDYEDTRIRKYFHLIGRSDLLVHIPASIHLFRLRTLPPIAAKHTLSLPVENIPTYASTARNLAPLWSQGGIASGEAWFRRLEVQLTPQGEPSVSPQPAALETLPGSAVTWKPEDENGAYFSLNTPSVRLLIGHLGGRTLSVGDAGFKVAARPWRNGLPAYACISLTALDRLPVAQSKRLLLAASARTENINMNWNEDRTSLTGKNAWGGKTTLSEAVPLTLTLPGKDFRGIALDAEGRPQNPVRVEGRNLELRAADKTLWVLIERQ